MGDGVKRILVTGGAGFIGANLCRLLLDQGHYVVCFDNFQTGYMSNVEELVDERFEIVEGDVEEPFFFDEVDEMSKEDLNLLYAAPKRIKETDIVLEKAEHSVG